MKKDSKKQEKRIKTVFPNDLDDISRRLETIQLYKEYLNKNLVLPVVLTGIEDFDWEEFYVLGPGDEEEYEELKKEQPSFTDEYDLISIDENCSEYYGIFANVKRISDKKSFQIPLADLTAIDRNFMNYQLLDDYVVWFFNY